MNNETIFADYNDTFSSHPELWGRVQGLITGVSWREYSSFRERKIGPGLPIYFYTGKEHETDMVAVAKFKSDIINAIGVTKFYENDETQVNVLKILCPKTKIIQVKTGVTAI